MNLDGLTKKLAKEIMELPAPLTTPKVEAVIADRLRRVISICEDALQPLVTIAESFYNNGLDGDARYRWGSQEEYVNKRDPNSIELFSGRGGKLLLTLHHCLYAQKVLRAEDGQESSFEFLLRHVLQGLAEGIPSQLRSTLLKALPSLGLETPEKQTRERMRLLEK